ncbi:MAG: SCO family protein [Pseudomonadota bacterium]|nr:SCO family protein [Pseudomonadota bacterium]
MNAARGDDDRRQRRLLVGLAGLFFAPLAVAFYLYYGPAAWRPVSHVNHGVLIDPARPLPDVSLPIAGQNPPRLSKPDLFRNKWTLLYVGAGGCATACRTDLYNTRQVRSALNRDMERVQRVFIATGDCCDWVFLSAQHPDLLVLSGAPAARPVLDRLPIVNGISPLAAERVYIVDPLGNLMMSYAPDAAAKGLLQDLKRLLGLSHVG